MKRHTTALQLLLLGALSMGFTTHSANAQTLSRLESEIIDLTNKFRQKNGRQPLRPDYHLMKTARHFACYMSRTNRYGHRADGRSATQRARLQGFTAQGCVSENIAWNEGYRNRSGQGAQFTNAWINSPGHRANMLTRGAKITGTGICNRGDKYYGVQLIGRNTWATLKIVNKTIHPIDYNYSLGKKRSTGQVAGIKNGTRWVTLKTCGYVKVQASQRKGSGRFPPVNRKAASTGDRDISLMFE